MPRRVICLDSESYRDKKIGSERHDFRLAVASFDTLDVQAYAYGETSWFSTTDPAALWEWVAAKTNRNHRTVVFAHNLSYDLRTTGALRFLPKLGFDVQGIGLNSYSCWVRLRKDRNTLWLCDSLSFVPIALERIAAKVGIDKPRLPDEDDSEEQWFARCRADVEITRAAMLRILRYLKEENLGDFRLTGSAMASAGYRHRFMPRQTLLVHDNEQALAAERRSAWAGRAEVWRHGEVAETLWEYDYQYAYARLAHDMSVPYRLECEHSPLPIDRLTTVAQHQAVLANCTVTTDKPLVPANRNEHIVWPIGTFETTLWDNEILFAVANGAKVETRECWLYARGHILRDWATWIIRQLDNENADVDPVALVMLKDWSRAVIGRFGLRYPKLEEIARLQSYDLAHRGVWDMDNEKELTYLQLGQQLFEQTEKVESSDSMPAIMSYIMAGSRIKLWNLVRVAGSGSTVYIDTDGVIVTKGGHERLSAAIKRGALPGLRAKGSYLGGSFRAPRNIDLGDERRVNGAPRRAERLTSGVYRGEVWESLSAALRRQRADNVFVHEREFHVSDNDPRRLHLPGGETAPHVIS